MPELEPPLLRARILADHELPREHICLECRTQSFGCLLSIGLMLRSTTVRAVVLRSRKDPAGVRADLVGQVLVDRGPPMPRCCFVLDPARIVFSQPRQKLRSPLICRSGQNPGSIPGSAISRTETCSPATETSNLNAYSAPPARTTVIPTSPDRVYDQRGTVVRCHALQQLQRPWRHVAAT